MDLLRLNPHFVINLSLSKGLLHQPKGSAIGIVGGAISSFRLRTLASREGGRYRKVS